MTDPAPIDMDLMRRLEPTEEWLREVTARGGEVVRAGPFLALFGGLGLQYAAPAEPLPAASEVEAALNDLRHIFAVRNRPLAIEFNSPLFPDLAPTLDRAGLELQEAEPLLTLVPTRFRPLWAADVDVHYLGRDAAESDLVAYAAIFGEVLLGETGPPPERAIERLRREIPTEGGTSHALASIGGRPVGTGFISSSGGVAEITRVATVPVARRRGVAATVTSFMLADRFARGDTLACLTASGSPAQTLYVKLGFTPAGARLYYRGP